MKNLGQRSRDLDIVVKEDIYKHITASGTTSGTLSSSDLALVLASPEKIVINNTYFYSSNDYSYIYYNWYGKGTDTSIFIYTIKITKSTGYYTKSNERYYCSSSAFTVNDPTITFTQGGTTKGTITLNQSSNQTIALDAGGGGVTLRRWS